MNISDIYRASISLPWRVIERLGIRRESKPIIAYIVEKQNWSIRWDGTQISEQINRKYPDLSRITVRPERITSAIAHFGSQFLWEIWHKHLSRKNRVVVSYFHGKPEDSLRMAEHVEVFLKNINLIDYIIVANSMVEKRLLDWGIPASQLVKIPIGVDTKKFFLPSEEIRKKARDTLGIPSDRFIVGSFQKDGVGWGKGMEPKMIKGPDVFLDTLKKLSNEFPILVLLTGPARGFLIEGLELLNIPYIHHNFENYFDIVTAYHALDVYLMTSREEGGPKSILECAATGVPVVASRVGMAPDFIVNSRTGYLVDVEDVEATVAATAQILSAKVIRESLRTAARLKVEKYDWSNVAKAHLQEVYLPLMKEMGVR